MARSTLPNLALPETSATPAAGIPARSVAANLALSLRPAQWTKNLLVFAALIFAVKLFDPTAVVRSIAACIVFCVLSGAVYLVNDIVDRDNDRRHPTKRRRPIAAGTLPVGTALAAAAALTTAALAAAFLLGWRFGLVAAGYVALQGLYSGPFKDIVIIDVLTLALGFVLRAVAGAVVIDVRISSWLFVCPIPLALLAALAKRRHEPVLL